MKHITEEEKHQIKELLKSAIVAFDIEEPFEAYNLIRLAMDKMED